MGQLRLFTDEQQVPSAQQQPVLKPASSIYGPVLQCLARLTALTDLQEGGIPASVRSSASPKSASLVMGSVSEDGPCVAMVSDVLINQHRIAVRVHQDNACWSG